MNDAIIKFMEMVDKDMVDHFIAADVRNSITNPVRDWDGDWERHELSMRRLKAHQDMLRIVSEHIDQEFSYNGLLLTVGTIGYVLYHGFRLDETINFVSTNNP